MVPDRAMSETLSCVLLVLLVSLVLGSVLTVVERKALGSGQRRFGPS